MPGSGLRTTTFKTTDDVKKGGGANRGAIWSTPKDGAVVRFLQEPTDWIGCYEIYDKNSPVPYYPMAEGDQIPEGGSVSFRYYANVLWQGDGQAQGNVVVYKFPKSVATKLINKFDKYGTVLDRDYEIDKIGEGLNTEYDLTPGDRKRVNTKGYELLDIEEQLVNDRNAALGLGSDDDDDDEPAPPKRGGRKTAVVDDDDEPDDEEEEDEDEEPARAAKKAPAKKAPAGRGRGAKQSSKPTLEELGTAVDDDEDEDAEATLTDLASVTEVDPNEFATWAEVAAAIETNLDALIDDWADAETWDDVINALADDDEESDDDEGDDDEEEDEEDEEEEEDDEEIEVDFDTLNAMSLKELREMADEYGIDHAPHKTKAKLVQAILDESEDEDE